MCFEGASAVSNDALRLTPWIGDWVTPRMCVGGSMPRASRTVGTRSMAWAYWRRIAPFALIPLGQTTRNGSAVPPR